MHAQVRHLAELAHMGRQLTWKYAAVAGAVIGGGAVAASAALSGAAAYFARRVVTRERTVPNNTHIASIGVGTITVRATADTLAPGRYGLWADGRTAHARVGDIISVDHDRRTVTRQLFGVDVGTLVQGPALWNAYYLIGTPGEACAVPFEDITISSAAGDVPAWYVPAPADQSSDTWVICVHGRGATRTECLRAVGVLHRLGMSILIPSYRNSHEGPVTGEGRYQLGDTEWEDIESAVIFALSHGARKVVCFGWSMGGAIVLQMVSRSWVADKVTALVLDSPVIDWNTVLTHQAKLHKLPAAVGRLGLQMLGHPAARPLLGTEAPVDLSRMDWVQRAAELKLPSLILHSDLDDTVPSGPSKALATARPDLVTYVDFPGARHTRGWNTDPDRWEREVARFLLDRL